MTLEEIQNLWEADANINRTELGEESLRIAQLHSKYFKIYSTERMRLRQYEQQYRSLYKIRFEYYMGTLDIETIREREWEPNPLKILRTDVPMHIDADQYLQELQLKVDLQKEKVDMLESIIKHLPNRGFNIKAAIEWAKFQHGG